MKKLLVTLTALLVSASAFGQGTISFNNFDPARGINAPVFKADGVTGAGAGIGANAQLFLVTGTGAAKTYTPLSPATTFRTSPAAAQGFVVPLADPVIATGIAPGAQATLVLRAWEGPSYDAAVAGNGMQWGQSAEFTVTTGGAGSPPSVPAALTGLQQFSMNIPEPSTMALGLIGAAALLYRRRK